MAPETAKTIDQQMQQIALDHLFIETLETRHSDRLLCGEPHKSRYAERIVMLIRGL